MTSKSFAVGIDICHRWSVVELSIQVVSCVQLENKEASVYTNDYQFLRL